MQIAIIPTTSAGPNKGIDMINVAIDNAYMNSIGVGVGEFDVTVMNHDEHNINRNINVDSVVAKKVPLAILCSRNDSLLFIIMISDIIHKRTTAGKQRTPIAGINIRSIGRNTRAGTPMMVPAAAAPVASPEAAEPRAAPAAGKAMKKPPL